MGLRAWARARVKTAPGGINGAPVPRLLAEAGRSFEEDLAANHRMGALEQDLAVILEQPGQRPTIVVPDMSQRALHALRWEAPGRWKELANLGPLAGRVERLDLRSDGTACATLADRSQSRIRLTR